MYTLGNKGVSTPSPNTLQQMFGDDAPIGCFVETDYKKSMSQALTLEAKIAAICDYAKELHEDQADYDYISPYGGLDITVQTVDEIAFKEVLRLFDGETRQDAFALLHKEFDTRNINLTYIKEIIGSYEKLQKMPQQLEKQYADYQLAKADYEKRVAEKVIELQEQGKAEYDRCEYQLATYQRFVQKSLIKKFFVKFQWSKTYKKLTSLSEECANAYLGTIVTEQFVIDNCFKEEDKPMYLAPCYWTPINSDEPDMKIIETEKDLKLAVTEIREQLMNPDNQQAYQNCKQFCGAREA